MKKLKTIIALALVSFATLANAGTLVETDGFVQKTAVVSEDKTLKLALTDYAKSNKNSLTFQWYKYNVNTFDFDLVTGATNHTLLLDPVATTDASYYYEVVSLGATSEQSTWIELTVKQDATLIVNKYYAEGEWFNVVLVGGSQTFAVNLTEFGQTQKDNNHLSFQWYKNGSAISGATHRTLTLTNIQPSDAAFYNVVVTDGTTTESLPQNFDLLVEQVF